VAEWAALPSVRPVSRRHPRRSLQPANRFGPPRLRGRGGRAVPSLGPGLPAFPFSGARAVACGAKDGTAPWGQSAFAKERTVAEVRPTARARSHPPSSNTPAHEIALPSPGCARSPAAGLCVCRCARRRRWRGGAARSHSPSPRSAERGPGPGARRSVERPLPERRSGQWPPRCCCVLSVYATPIQVSKSLREPRGPRLHRGATTAGDIRIE
jgi:hypothetical protein